jgi:hypothetical protein
VTCFASHNSGYCNKWKLAIYEYFFVSGMCMKLYETELARELEKVMGEIEFDMLFGPEQALPPPCSHVNAYETILLEFYMISTNFVFKTFSLKNNSLLYSCHSSSIDMKFALQPEKLVEEGEGRMLSDEA